MKLMYVIECRPESGRHVSGSARTVNELVTMILDLQNRFPGVQIEVSTVKDN
jgi:hypothetical protein